MIPQTMPTKVHPCTDAIMCMLQQLTNYCNAYKAELKSEVGNDAVLGADVLAIAQGVRGLLNGPGNSGEVWEIDWDKQTRRYVPDRSGIDAMILSMLTTAGFSDADINN